MTVEIAPCSFCGKDYLPGYPHRHETPLRGDYDPMAARPAALPDLLALLRSEYLAELPGRLHVAYVPTELVDGMLDAGIGPAFAPIFNRRIGAIRLWQGGVTVDDKDLAPFPYYRQLEGVRRWCAGKHRTWYEHRGDPLCYVLLRLVTLGGYSIGRAAQLADVSESKALELLEVAAGKWYGWVSNDLNGIDLRKRPPTAQPSAKLKPPGTSR